MYPMAASLGWHVYPGVPRLRCRLPLRVLQGDVLPDGSDASDVEQWRARRAAERELKAAEEAVGRGEQVCRLTLQRPCAEDCCMRTASTG